MLFAGLSAFVEFEDLTNKDNQTEVDVRVKLCAIDFEALSDRGNIERWMILLILSWAKAELRLQDTRFDHPL